jgi:hypothetical protein
MLASASDMTRVVVPLVSSGLIVSEAGLKGNLAAEAPQLVLGAGLAARNALEAFGRQNRLPTHSFPTAFVTAGCGTGGGQGGQAWG